MRPSGNATARRLVLTTVSPRPCLLTTLAAGRRNSSTSSCHNHHCSGGQQRLRSKAFLPSTTFSSPFALLGGTKRRRGGLCVAAFELDLHRGPRRAFGSSSAASASSVSYVSHFSCHLQPDRIAQLAEHIVEHSNEIYQQVIQVRAEERTFANTIQPLADLEAHTAALYSSCTFPAYVSLQREAREQSSKADQQLQSFFIESGMREDLYRAVKEYADGNKQREDEKLSSEQKRVVDKLILEFEQNGLALPAAQRERLKAIRKEIADYCIQFQRNLNEDNTFLEFTKEELSGVPEDVLQGLEQMQADDKTSKYKVTLRYPDLVPVLQHADNPETRRKLDYVNGRKCIDVNEELLRKVLLLRQEAAEMLGYKDHASFVLKTRMAKTPQTVFQFVNELSDRLTEKAHEEYNQLLQLKKKDNNTSHEMHNDKIHSYDFSYYHNKLLNEKYQLDENEVKRYFPVDSVIKGTLEVFQEVFSLRFTQVEDDKAPSELKPWHSDIRLFSVHDADTNEFMGHFYLDLWPREGKYSHAAVFPLQPSHRYSTAETSTTTTQRQYPIAAMVTNFTKPQQNKPSLLTHQEVVTFFHEFGHLLHNLCTKVNYAKFSGTDVERDFVEAPSQIMEYWAYEPDVLRRLSQRQEEGTIPDSLIEKIVATKNVNTALLNKRQIFFSLFDMTVHTLAEEEQKKNKKGLVEGTADLWRDLRKSITLIEQQPDTNPAASFGHIVGGYDAQYYGYKYSQVFAADMYSLFQEAAQKNSSPASSLPFAHRKVGKRFRDIILARGGTKDSIYNLKEFLGREPNQDAFLRHIDALPISAAASTSSAADPTLH